jgi:hypothetical protein
MKEAPVLVWVSVLIVGGIGIWLATGGSLPSFSTQPIAVQPATASQLGDSQADGPQKAAAVKPAKKPPANAARTTSAATAAQTALEPVVVAPVAEVVIAPPVPAPEPKQFPSAKEISVGAERDHISERFGEPSLATTTTSDHGRVMETLVYARKSGRDVTVILIEDGKVLSAYSR